MYTIYSMTFKYSEMYIMIIECKHISTGTDTMSISSWIFANFIRSIEIKRYTSLLKHTVNLKKMIKEAQFIGHHYRICFP